MEYYASFKGEFGRVQVEVLSYLYDNQSTHVQQFADMLTIPKQHASKILARLQEQGLVTRQSDPADGRSVLFSLSSEGLQLMEDHLAVSHARFTERFCRLSEEKQAELVRAMEMTTQYLKEL
ncbi:MAG: MarR family transcriptional regulator [Clostridia bacterium]|nr:MarR family transcriptional regulator [Clostridia bacterium]